MIKKGWAGDFAVKRISISEWTLSVWDTSPDKRAALCQSCSWSMQKHESWIHHQPSYGAHLVHTKQSLSPPVLASLGPETTSWLSRSNRRTRQREIRKPIDQIVLLPTAGHRIEEQHMPQTVGGLPTDFTTKSRSCNREGSSRMR